MAYEYYLQAYFNQEPQEIPVDFIIPLLAKYVSNAGENFFDICFDPENRCTVFMDRNSKFIGNLTISRPCSGPDLCELIYQLMQTGNFIFFEPDGKYAIILSANIEAHLPPEMIETLGKPKTAVSKEHFFELLTNAR
ncbi:hypothetical protein [Pseudoflavitalea rhizosphaerae]|uniref:hypothetical protein n=1 Tax=Pseudoflavitalea rhizosphaerae TaxID=1884793 RepID=UPI000F8E183C|nr:hypothetical protein [Pseudoflavitalea rhizosphaerae]